MASLTIISGSVTHLDRVSSTHGSVSHGRGSIQTTHALMFRLDGKPAMYLGVADLSVGDPATAAGLTTNGAFKALAVRNDATGLVFGRSGWPEMIVGGIVLLIALLAFQANLILGLAIGALGGWIFRRGLLVRGARQMLLAPAPAYAPNA